MRLWAILPLAAFCAGCASKETIRFQAGAQQQAMMRDGNPALVSRQKGSIVLARPAARTFDSNARPAFIIGLNNLGAGPIEFAISNVRVTQRVEGREYALHVFTYDELAQEERNRQVAMAVLAGVAVGANAVAASNAGYYNRNSTVSTPRGTYQVSTTGYSPTAAAIAQSNAAAQNEAIVATTIEQGQRNMANLERAILKDNTLLPGEWYGGQLHLSVPSDGAGRAKQYIVVVDLGQDRHELVIEQGTAH